ncbi:MAG: DUF1501 domain-containing protein [Planctomycetales bacterium]|nr:DUF1501 domain-containing protein [Planctomycetales bacterium]
MNRYFFAEAERTRTRRDFLSDAVLGIGGIALAQLLVQERACGSELEKRTDGLHHAPRARRLIHIYLGGGLSQVDSFDFKPALEKYHNTEIPAEFQADAFFQKIGRLHQSHFKFSQRGQSGLWVSELFPNLATVADELCVIRSMQAETANHTPGTFQALTGFRQMGFPSLGAWLSYGLGTATEDLPSFVVLPDPEYGIPNGAGGSFSWGAGFLPAEHQGVAFNTRSETPVLDLQPSVGTSARTQQARLELLRRLNKQHLEEIDTADADPLVARIQSYETAARMQAAVPLAMDLDSEPEHIRTLYGFDDPIAGPVARNFLAARRLVERGVRTVQIWSGDGITWDAHEDITGEGYKTHTGQAKRYDRPLAGLIQDLRQRGMLDDTLVVISSEFGRTPYAQADQGTLSKGRDHHPEGFSNVLVGGGVRGGFAYGETDEIGYHAVRDVVTTPDFHATILHLLGIDHERLTFYHNGIDRRLTNVHGRVAEGALKHQT